MREQTENTDRSNEARIKFQQAFRKDFADAWRTHGIAALGKAVADLTDDELAAIVSGRRS